MMHKNRIASASVVLLTLWAGHALAQDDSQPTKSVDSAASVNPARADDLVIEFISVKSDDENGTATLTAHLCNFRPDRAYAAIVWGDAVGMKEVGYLESGEVKEVSLKCPFDDVPFDEPIFAQVYNVEIHKLETTDTADLYGEDARTVAIVFEKSAFDEGNQLFGSAMWRIRQMVEGLNNADTAGDDSTAFRFEHFVVFDPSKDEQPALINDHPPYDIVVTIGADSLANIWTKDGAKELGEALK